MAEHWKPVVGYEGWYEVSSLGRVRNAKERHGTSLGHVLTGSPGEKGYLQVCLTVDKKQKVKDVHRLVSEAFIGPLPSGYQTDHINGIKTDCKASNLQYITGLENMRKSYLPEFNRHVLRGEEHGNARWTVGQIKEVKHLLSSGMIHRLVAERTGVSKATVDQISSGRQWVHVA